ncbi:MAG: TetR/AcrR family transcriptional regulator [bacterium]|nr:TetR/AcrR family transcriptional regulator [bacterium]
MSSILFDGNGRVIYYTVRTVYIPISSHRQGHNMGRPSSKNAILDAAEAIVLESGAAHLTLDAVAERSTISKGGLIYHFPTKEALLEAMIGRLMERHEQLRDQARRELAPEPSNELLVEIRMLQKLSEADYHLSASLLAVTANQPELAKAFHEKYRRRFHDEIMNQERFERSAILLFAAVGLHFHDMFNMSLLNDEQRGMLYAALLRLARGGDAL